MSKYISITVNTKQVCSTSLEQLFTISLFAEIQIEKNSGGFRQMYAMTEHSTSLDERDRDDCTKSGHGFGNRLLVATIALERMLDAWDEWHWRHEETICNILVLE